MKMLMYNSPLQAHGKAREGYSKTGLGCDTAESLPVDTCLLPNPAVLTAESSPSLPRGW